MKNITLDISSTHYISYHENIEVTCITCSKKVNIRCNTDEVEVKFCSNCGDTNLELMFEEEVTTWGY